MSPELQKLIHTIDSNRLWIPATKTHSIWAREIREATQIETPEGIVTAKAGDFLCRGRASEVWPQHAKTLNAKYSQTTDKDGDWTRYTPVEDRNRVFVFELGSALTLDTEWGTQDGKCGDFLVTSTKQMPGSESRDLWIVDGEMFRVTHTLDIQQDAWQAVLFYPGYLLDNYPEFIEAIKSEAQTRGFQVIDWRETNRGTTNVVIEELHRIITSPTVRRIITVLTGESDEINLNVMYEFAYSFGFSNSKPDGPRIIPVVSQSSSSQLPFDIAGFGLATYEHPVADDPCIKDLARQLTLDSAEQKIAFHNKAVGILDDILAGPESRENLKLEIDRFFVATGDTEHWLRVQKLLNQVLMIAKVDIRFFQSLGSRESLVKAYLDAIGVYAHAFGDSAKQRDNGGNCTRQVRSLIETQDVVRDLVQKLSQETPAIAHRDIVSAMNRMWAFAQSSIDLQDAPTINSVSQERRYSALIVNLETTRSRATSKYAARVFDKLLPKIKMGNVDRAAEDETSLVADRIDDWGVELDLLNDCCVFSSRVSTMAAPEDFKESIVSGLVSRPSLPSKQDLKLLETRASSIAARHTGLMQTLASYTCGAALGIAIWFAVGILVCSIFPSFISNVYILDVSDDGHRARKIGAAFILLALSAAACRCWWFSSSPRRIFVFAWGLVSAAIVFFLITLRAPFVDNWGANLRSFTTMLFWFVLFLSIPAFWRIASPFESWRHLSKCFAIRVMVVVTFHVLVAYFLTSPDPPKTQVQNGSTRSEAAEPTDEMKADVFMRSSGALCVWGACFVCLTWGIPRIQVSMFPKDKR